MLSEATAEPPGELIRNRIAAHLRIIDRVGERGRDRVGAHHPAVQSAVVAVAALDLADALNQGDHRRIAIGRDLDGSGHSRPRHRLGGRAGPRPGLLEHVGPVTQPIDQPGGLRFIREVRATVDQPRHLGDRPCRGPRRYPT